MTGRHGPPLFSLNYNLALEAVNLMRRREADPHHGQGRDRPSNRSHEGGEALIGCAAVFQGRV